MCRRSHSISRYKSRLMDPKDHVHMHSSTSIPLSHSRHEEVRALRAVYLSGTLGTPTWPMYGGKKFPLTSKVPSKHRTSDTEDTRYIINPSPLPPSSPGPNMPPVHPQLTCFTGQQSHAPFLLGHFRISDEGTTGLGSVPL